jgi:arylsulfatase A-like enzyme
MTMRTGAKRPTLPATLAVAAALAAALFAVLWFAFRPHPPLNVILISIDTLRPDRMGVYGHRPMGRSTTPFLDELAAGGALFTRAVSTSSWTLPAHYALMTGLPDAAHGMVNDRVPPPDDLPMLAEILKKGGYETAGFYSGAYLHPLFGFDRGFDTYESCLPVEGRRGRQSSAASQDGPPETKFAAHEAVTSARVTDRAFAFLSDFARREADKPFFLFLHYFDVHNDYLPPSPFDRGFGPPYDGWVNGRGVTSDPRYTDGMAPEDHQRLLALYDGEIAWVDDNLRRLFRGIGTLEGEITENTLVIVTSDHGEEFFEHGRAGHRKNLFASSIDIPLILVCPGRIAEGVRVEIPARLYDILPTVTDLCGVDTAAEALGRSLLPTIAGTDRAPRPALLDLTKIPKEGSLERITGIAFDGFKLITRERRKWAVEGDSFASEGIWTDRKHALYDLTGDPGEKRDLFSDRRNRAERLLQVRELLLEEVAGSLRERARGEGRSVEIPDHIKKNLDELGY